MSNERDKAFEVWWEDFLCEYGLDVLMATNIPISAFMAGWAAREEYEGEAGLLNINHVCPKCEFTRGINGFCGCSIVKSDKNVNPEG